jgi:uncharacterized protein
MTNARDEPPVVDDEANSRFLLVEGGLEAELVYRHNGNRLVLVHTGVPEEMAGRGVGARLVQFAVERGRQEGWIIVPLCPYARGWLEKHPDAAATVTIDWSEPGDGGAA